MFHLTWMLIWSIWVIVACCIHYISKLCIYIYKSCRQRCLQSILFVDLPSNKGNHIQSQLVHFSHIEGAISVLLRLRIIFIFTSIFRHHFDNLRTRGPQFCLWLMWPQLIVIAVDCNFPHFWFSQCWDVFCQLHSIGYRNHFLVATLSFHVGSSSYFHVIFKKCYILTILYKDHMFPTGWCFSDGWQLR